MPGHGHPDYSRVFAHTVPRTQGDLSEGHRGWGATALACSGSPQTSCGDLSRSLRVGSHGQLQRELSAPK
jgi:hypothetical protein